MDSAAPARAVASAVGDKFAGLSAGYRLIILLTLALLPLGLLAILASLQSSRGADLERQAMVRISAAESARRLGSQLAVDRAALVSATNLLEIGTAPDAICARTQGVLATSLGEPTDFAIVSRDGALACGSEQIARETGKLDVDRDMATSLSDRGLTVVLPGDTRAFIAIAHYPKDQLARILSATGLTGYDLTLGGGGKILALIDDFAARPFDRRETITAGVPNTSLQVVLSVPSVPFTAAEILTLSLPLIMWLAAVTIAWLVFNRLVIAPLAQLRANVSSYQPGEILQPLRRMTIPAREIEELGRTFQGISQTVAEHEDQLAIGLARQTRLTREVHHRVKNNLQVVSSLINLHARASRSPDAADAYASIGRRVDALAVVHRNHYAELEENRGVNLRALIGELAANLRATAPGQASRLSILIDVPAVQVGQDTAIPIAFLNTEIVELAMAIDPGAKIRVSVTRLDEVDRACLTIASRSFAHSDEMQQLLATRYGRVLEGLSRQLRSPLERDEDAGVFKVCFPIIPDGLEGTEK